MLELNNDTPERGMWNVECGGYWLASPQPFISTIYGATVALTRGKALRAKERSTKHAI